MKLKGTVIFRLANVGSQSEGVFPYLYVGDAEFIKIYVIDDNPFENELLKKYDGVLIEAEGDYNDYGTFVMEEDAITALTEFSKKEEPELEKKAEIEFCEKK